jgi:hypothetical protein
MSNQPSDSATAQPLTKHRLERPEHRVDGGSRSDEAGDLQKRVVRAAPLQRIATQYEQLQGMIGKIQKPLLPPQRNGQPDNAEHESRYGDEQRPDQPPAIIAFRRRVGCHQMTTPPTGAPSLPARGQRAVAKEVVEQDWRGG